VTTRSTQQAGSKIVEMWLSTTLAASVSLSTFWLLVPGKLYSKINRWSLNLADDIILLLELSK